MDTKSVSQALVVCFLAIGQAIGEDKLLQAGKHLRVQWTTAWSTGAP